MSQIKSIIDTDIQRIHEPDYKCLDMTGLTADSALVIDNSLNIALKSSTKHSFITRNFRNQGNLIEGGKHNG